jgi:hypothetical protein
MREIEVHLPTFYPAQVAAFDIWRKNRFVVGRCGRRWGKTGFAEVIAVDAAVKGQSVGWFAPDYKVQAEAYNEIATTLDPVKLSSSKVEGVIRTMTGGRIDFWTMENERAGRSRKYHKVIMDEAAFTKSNAIDIWEKSIKPTLLDYKGKALVISNTNGVSPDNFLYKICEPLDVREMGMPGPKYGFAEFHGPTHQNPYLPADELERLERENHPLVYRQEYLAEFVSWDGIAFFGRDSLLVDDQPVPYPRGCDAVYATVDTAVKSGRDHDGLAVTFFAMDRHSGKHPITVLDWDISHLEGSLLEAWLPNVFRRLEELAKLCGARMGSLGAWIEDKVSGTILLQQAQRRGWPAHAIDSALTAVGKDERAISVSGYVFSNKVKVSDHAYEKVTTYKEATRNHFMTQIMGFRIGAKDNPQDDLLDTFTYGLAIGLGNQDGY